MMAGDSDPHAETWCMAHALVHHLLIHDQAVRRG